MLPMVLLSLSGCSSSRNPSNEFYHNLYKTSTPLEVFLDEIRMTTKALYGYNQNKVQGYNSWYYLAGSISSPFELNYDESTNSFTNGKVSFKDELVTSNGQEAIRKYVSRIEGSGYIYGNFKALNEKSSAFNIKMYQNSTLLYEFGESKGDTIGKYFEIPVNLSKGDEIYFVILGDNANVLFNPVITLEKSQDESMYHLNDFNKQYGDVFPYYDTKDNKLKIWYLWTDDCLANNGNNYSYAIDVSSNMLSFDTYEEANNYDLYYNLYNDYFLQRIYDVNRFIPTGLYDVGVRDNFVYRDEERMYMIAGCYRKFDVMTDCDLMIYASDDPLGLSWTKEGVKVGTYTGSFSNGTGHLPECPSLLKIGNRWYSFVSVSHVTKHQIGALQYWIGDENKDFLDVSWEEKEIAFLDGEDLCAARPTQIGDKFYMWGWITASHDGVPLKPWGGYLNLPREIVQREDGSLGGRMDPGLTKVLNYGNILNINEDIVLTNENNEYPLINNQNRNFVTYDVDMSLSSKVSFVVRQNDKMYTCSIEKEEDGVYMKIETPADRNHPVNSKLKIRYPSSDDKYQIKIVLDNGIFEFFVNDDNALSAKTSMTNDLYNLSVSSDNNAIISNMKINKLRSYADLEF